MLFQRPIFGFLALLYCVCLGVFALVNNPHSRLNRSFAFYNLTNALYNASDYLIFFPDHEWGLWYFRICSVGGCFMFPFLMSFIFQLIGVAEEERYRNILKGTTVIGIVFALLHFTPWMLKDVRYQYLQSTANVEVPGPAYYLFALWGLGSLGIVLSALPKALRSPIELHRKRAMYVATACFLGFCALLFYFGSLFWIDLPAVYMPLQALVGFTFSYSIFKHNLIPVSVAIKRAAVLLGIYIAIVFTTVPIVMLHQRITDGTSSYGTIRSEERRVGKGYRSR